MMRSMACLGLFGVALAAFAGANAGCGDDGRQTRTLGSTCNGNTACESGLCMSAVCVDPAADDDRDGLINGLEAALGTDPFAADSDDDGTDDIDELTTGRANVDTDGDGIPDALESSVSDADSDCITDELDAENDVSNADLSPLIPKLCRMEGACGAEGAVLSVECPGDATTAVCVYTSVPNYESLEATCDELDNDCDGTADGAGLCGDAPSIIGTWVSGQDENDFLTVVFFDDGTYFHGEVDFDDETEISGMERGKYTWDTGDGRLTVTQDGYLDNNGDTGLTDFAAGTEGPRLWVTVTETTLTARVDEDGDDVLEETLEFTRQPATGIVGTWRVDIEGMDFLMLTFFQDGSYVLGEIDLNNDPSTRGMEWGDYTTAEGTGMLTASPSFDNNGDAGLSSFVSADTAPFLFVAVAGDVLTVTIDEDGDDAVDDTVSFTRVGP
ncbi:MAG: hypothetical protein ACI9MR_001577 [Myxococcota bacterium]|jgi:hypothetical protein